MSPKPKLRPPQLVMLLLLLKAKAKFILTPTQTDTNTELHSTAERPVQWSHDLISFFFFFLPPPLHSSLLLFRNLPVITLYRRKQGAGLMPA